MIAFSRHRNYKIASSYPDFGMPDSTEELKLKLEIIGWSIL